MIRLASTALLLLALAAPAAAATVTGTPDADRLTGGTTADTLFGGPGADLLWGDPTAGVGLPRAMDRVTLGLDGKKPTLGVSEYAISADGRWMVFASESPEFLPPAFANGKAQVFLKDLVTGQITLLSGAADGSPGNQTSSQVALSADGTKAAFVTRSSNLSVANPKPGSDFIIVHDRLSGQKTLGTPIVSPVGQGVYLQLVLSPNGQKLAFATNGANLGAVDTNSFFDTYIVPLDEEPIRAYRASTTSSGMQVQGGVTFPLAFSPDGTQLLLSSTANTFLGNAANDKNGTMDDVFEKELKTFHPNGEVVGSVVLVSSSGSEVQDIDGLAYTASYSPDGREVAFDSSADVLLPAGQVDANGSGVDIFVKTLRPGGLRPVGTVRIVSRSATGMQGDGFSGYPVFSPDGARLLFLSTASNLAQGANGSGYQTLVKDISRDDGTGPVTLASRSLAGQKLAANAAQYQATLVRDGRAVAFMSEADNLDPADNDNFADLYIATLAAPVGGNDVLDGGPGADRMAGSAGNDTYVVDDAGDAVIEQPGEGSDTVKTPFPGTVPANIESMTLTGTTAGALTGSAVANGLTGNGAANTIKGLAGNDTLKGGAGKDLLYGGDGNDTLDGGSEVDVLKGEAGNDALAGGDGNDVLVGATRNDVLSGGAGNDTLDGGAGTDRLTGGAGADRFVIAKTTDSRASARDTITDFSARSGDRIVLSAIDANSRRSGNQAFTWIGSKRFSGKPGQLRFARGVLSGDVNGDRRADLAIVVKGAVTRAAVGK